MFQTTKNQILYYLPAILFAWLVSGAKTYATTTATVSVVFGEGFTHGTLCAFIRNVRFWLYVIGISISIVVYIIAGIMYLQSGGVPDKTQKALKIFKYTTIGLVIVIIAGLLPESIGKIFIPDFKPEDCVV